MADLQHVAHEAKRHWGYPEQWIEEWHDALTLRRDDLETQRVFVAESDGGTVGFCAVKPAASTWSLEHMWVLPAFMTRGIGEALLRGVLEQMKREGCRRLTIESDPNAEGFYVRRGARRVGQVTTFVSGTERNLPVLEIDIP